MKGVLSFNLPEEKEDFQTAQNGWNYRFILHDLDMELRRMTKYEGQETIKIDTVRDLIRAIAAERDIFEIS